MPTRLQKAIGAVKDQTTISLARVNSSSNLEVAVVRATTHDDVPIDERYIYEVLQLVSSNKVYAATCARAIGKRITRTRNWIVALKSLMLVLRIFQDGDPYFPREVLLAMKRGAKILNLSSFRDESHSDPWDYTAFVRTFALYLEERLECFLTGKLQQRYTFKERDRSHSFRTMVNESIRDMKPSMLLERIGCWQRLLDRVIATKPTASAKMNRLIQIALSVIVKESFDFYKDISDGLVIILESFFHLQYQACECAIEICVKAVKQFEELRAFYSLCKNIGIGRISEYPNIQTISEESIERMQQFLKNQSSSPIHEKPLTKPLLAPGQGARSPSSCDSGGRPELDKRSEFGAQCSLIEDLISATETGKRTPISIDLEAYSDQFEKKSQQEEPFRVSYSSSTRSLPVKHSMIDLLSLDDWPEEELRREQERKHDLLDTISSNDSTNTQHSTSSKDLQLTSDKNLMQTTSGKGWELVLAESVAPLPPTRDNGLNDFKNSQELVLAESIAPSPPTRDNGLNDFENHQVHERSGSKEGWELALAGTPRQQQTDRGILSNTFNASTAMTLYDQPQPQPQPQSSPFNHYNPFLDDVPVTAAAHTPSTLDFNPFSTQPAFQTTSHSRPDPHSAALRKTQSDRFATAPHISQNDPFLVRSLSNQNDSFTGSSHPSQNNPFVASSHRGQDKAFVPPAQSKPSDPFAAASHNNDPSNPFASRFRKEDHYNEKMNQQNSLKQQQLWLQHQHKIMAKNMANV